MRSSSSFFASAWIRCEDLPAVSGGEEENEALPGCPICPTGDDRADRRHGVERQGVGIFSPARPRHVSDLAWELRDAGCARVSVQRHLFDRRLLQEREIDRGGFTAASTPGRRPSEL